MAPIIRLRLAAHDLISPSPRWGVAALCLALSIGLAGCGGGGGGGSNVPPPTTTASTVSGTTTDVTGASIVGATVTLGRQSATSTQFGTYTIPNVSAGVFTITATSTIRGRNWSGQNTVEVLSASKNTSNVQLVLSDTALQGSISGTVSDNRGRLAGAKVYAAAPDPNQQGSFITLSSIYTVTGANGSYTIPRLPPGPYTVTASLAGHLNQTVNATVTSNTTTPASFTLNVSNGPSTVPVVADLSALSLTMPATATTRAVSNANYQNALNAIRQYIFKQRGLLNHRLPDPTRVTLRKKATTRSTPSGSIIENDLFWPYDSTLNNVFGYDILRSANVDTQFVSIALVRDPLADRFSDVDDVLTPDINYYYSVARVDTITFPINGAEGDPVNPPVVVKPLQPISSVGPNDGVTIAGAPTFSWTAVPRAFEYHVLLYDRFPDLQSDTDPNGVAPIWVAPNQSSPDPSVVRAPATSLTYNGPALVSSHTYYWAVLVDDVSQSNPNISAQSAFAITPIRSFTAQ